MNRARRGLVPIVTLWLAFAAALLPFGTATASPATGAQQWGPAEEAAFVAKINELRSSKGLAPLTVDAELTEQARLWAEKMRQAGRISHAPNLSAGITSDWQMIGENVGVGGDVDGLFKAFVESPTHYENLVEPSYRYVGVGVVWDGNRMFTTHRFMSLRPKQPTTTAPPAAPQPAPAPAPAPAPTTTTTTTTTTPPEPEPSAPPPPQAPPARPERLELITRSLGAFFDE